MGVVNDMAAAVRSLLAARGFTVIVVLTLASGLALSAAIFTVVNAYALRPLPYPEADRLFRVDYAPPDQPFPRGMQRLEWSTLEDVIEVPIAWDLDVFYLLGRDYPEAAPGAWVTPGYIGGLGIRVVLGRALEPDDYRPDRAPVALISHRLWRSQFGGDVDVIGRVFNAYVSDRPEEPEAFTIVGVLPETLWHLNVYTEVLAPLRAPSYPYQVRLRPGVSPAVATERIDRLIRSGIASLPPHYGVTLTGLQDSYIAPLRPMLWSVVAGVALVLLIAAANVGVLMIVRGHARERELAVRLALGASRSRVARLVMYEGALVSVAATGLGLIVAAVTMPVVAPLLERALDRPVPGGLDAFSLDSRVMALVVACGAAMTLTFTLLPMLMVWRSPALVGIGTSNRGATSGARAGRSRALLIGLEVAASLTLLTSATLMAESAIRMLRVDFGFDGDGVVTAGLALRQQSFPSEADRAAFYQRLEAELERLPGTTAVAFGDWWPLQGSRPRRVEADGDVATANPFAVSPRYFDALGMRLVAGRAFTAEDRLGREPVVIISDALASRLWAPGQAVGRHLTIRLDGNGPALTALVIGVVNNVRQSHADADLVDAYLPLAQGAGRFAFVYLRGSRAASWETDVRAAIARVNPEVAMGTPRALGDGLDQERARPLLLTSLLTVFAAFACVLALIGMHGVIAYAVSQRRREIAVRMAVGADSRAVTTLFLRHGAGVLGVGLAAGVVGALGLGRVLESQLFGVRAAEPRLLAAAVLLFGTVALAAMLWPARRAAAVDPALVLKEE
jgi:putative ABC transport system permease protein